MFKKSQLLFKVFGLLTLLFTVQLVYLLKIEIATKKQLELKKNFIKTTTLPDLAISSETPYIRHRSLATPFDIYRDDTSLLEYYPSTFIYKANK